MLEKSEYDLKKYSGHSFCRGGATLGFQVGLRITEIKQRGDWVPSALDGYIYISASASGGSIPFVGWSIG